MGEQGTLDLVDYICNIIGEVVAEDRGLPLTLMIYPNLYAECNLIEFIYKLASNGSTGENIQLERYRPFILSATEVKQGEISVMCASVWSNTNNNKTSNFKTKNRLTF